MAHDDNADGLRRKLLGLLSTLAVSDSLAAAPGPEIVQPESYRVAFENDRLRVLDFISRPGKGLCGSGKHSHPAHLSIALTAAKVRVVTADGKTIIGESKAGDVFWSEAETHTTENISGHDARAMIIELKGHKA